jgi:chemotaxis protein histidine kinase CheA
MSNSKKIENILGHLFETIESPSNLKNKISYRNLSKGATHPVENANKQVEFLSIEFSHWINSDIDKLKTSWAELLSNQDDPTAFLSFNKAVHTIKGNAAILGFDKAGDLASPLTKLLEKSPQVSYYSQAISLMVQAISLSISPKNKEDKTKNDICLAFETIIKSHIAIH